MYLLLGLGNPGREYEKTRHNIGFHTLAEFAEQHRFPEFRLEKKFKAEISIGDLAGKKIILAKPQTFMNLSGEATRALLDFFKLEPSQVIATYDDVDLPFGTLRIRETGGSGGHNGVKSLIAHLGTEDFPRVRIGVGNELLEQIPTDKFVLANFSAEEAKQLPEILQNAAAALTELVQNGLESAGNQFNS
jgi:PTH1 family peptidyl-tRNA hydrolase